MADSPPRRPRSCSSRPAVVYAPAADLLEKRFLHHVLLWSNLPAAWPPVVTGLLLLVLVGCVGILWWSYASIQAGTGVLAVLATVIAGDAIILIGLPRRRVSFGPIAPQLVVLAAPRLAATTGLVLVAPFLGVLPACGTVAVINLAASLALLWATCHEPAEVGVTRMTLPVPWMTSPLRLAHVGDVHVERMGRREEAVVGLVRAAAPDLVLLTGDYVNLSNVRDPVAHSHARQFLASLCGGAVSRAWQPALYAVLGSPPVDRNSASLFDGLSIRLLRDEVAIHHCRSGGDVALIGMDCHHDVERDTVCLEQLAARVPQGMPTVLLYHSPELMPVAVRLRISLYLCGHTHGGQVRLPKYGALVTSSRLGKRYEMGYYREGDTQLYLTRGVGFEGLGAPRVRFLCPPEIVLLSLIPASNSSFPAVGE
jgi:predicted MPP superfamily phosphohydrolase